MFTFNWGHEACGLAWQCIPCGVSDQSVDVHLLLCALHLAGTKH